MKMSTFGLACSLMVFATANAMAKGPSFGPEVTFGDAVTLGDEVGYDDGRIPPIPDGAPIIDGEPVLMPVPGCELFPCVRYKDECKISPCAVPMIVAINDPCFRKDRCNPCAKPACVFVKICVPQCDCPKVKVTRQGNRVKYDYGKYEIVLTSNRAKGEVVVNYND